MGYYKAYICRAGHVGSIWKDIDYKQCKTCGSEMISECPECHAPFRGDDKDVMVHNTDTYIRPLCCYNCGKPLPWTQQVIDNAVMAISLDGDVPEEAREAIKLAIPDLVMEKPSSTFLAVARYHKYIGKFSEVTQNLLKEVLISFCTEAVINKLFS